MAECSHLTVASHKSGDKWRCSGCGKLAKWGPTWQWYGAIECRRCGAEPIEFVVCSEACIDAVKSERSDLKKRQKAERQKLDLEQIDEQIAALQIKRAALTAASKRGDAP